MSWTNQRLLPISLAVAASLSIAAPIARAQDATDQPADKKDAKEMEGVTVTGSRIKKTQSETQSPIMTMEREELEKTGLTNVGEVLQQLTTGGKALNAKFNSSGNFGFPADGGGIGAGSSQVDLRHLESKRVLVLVDGKRWVNESSASGVGGSVDLNTIPLAIVDRIEILEDGASAIYGSDAIAGVINIYTRRTFDGASINTYYGQYDKGDGETTKAEFTVGGGDERFNGVFSASYNETKRISSGDRDISKFPVPGAGVTRGSSGTPQGRFIFCDPRVTPACGGDDFISITLRPGTATPIYNRNNPTSGTSTYKPFELSDRFNFAPFNLLLTPSTKKALYSSVRYGINDNVSLYAKALYNNRTSVNQAAPEPIFIGGDAGTGGLADTISISRLNPFNPFGIDLIAGQNFSLIGRRPIEGGPRIFKQDVNTYYFSTGVEGTLNFGENVYSWDVNYQNSSNRAQQNFFNGYNLRRMQIALGDPAICAANPGCVPLNLFGGQGANGQGTITPEMLNWIRINTKDSSQQDLDGFSANFTGDLFQLPAGPLAFAAGFEHRGYAGSFSPDSVRIAGESQDSSAIQTAGKYHVNELYAEFSIPILEHLELTPAIRRSNYSTFGSNTSGKLGIRFQPIEDLVLRGTYAEGFRAPFIGELFGLAQFGASITDPCSNFARSGNATLIANCNALGLPQTYEQINTQITTNTGGNTELGPEKAKSFTLGAVYAPSWAEDTSWARKLDFEVTYYDHKVDDAIQAIDAQALLNLCVASRNTNRACLSNGRPVIGRTPNGQINRFDNKLQNIGSIRTDGYDLRINWRAPENDIGDFALSWANTYVHKYESSDTFGNIQPRTVGVELNDSAIPKYQSNARLDFTRGNLSISWATRFINEVTETCSDFRDNSALSLASLGLCSNPVAQPNNELSTNHLGGTTYHDLSANWKTPFTVEGLTLDAGINNLFAKDAPTCVSCSLNGYDAGTYDLPGRYFYVQANYKF
jgi:iron complex outermembrane recepter protein